MLGPSWGEARLYDRDDIDRARTVFEASAQFDKRASGPGYWTYLAKSAKFRVAMTYHHGEALLLVHPSWGTRPTECLGTNGIRAYLAGRDMDPLDTFVLEAEWIVGHIADLERVLSTRQSFSAYREVVTAIRSQRVE